MVLTFLTRRSLVAALAVVLAHAAAAQPRTITVASTTSTEQSGLFAHLLPAFTARTGIAVKVVAVGTGQAMDIGRRGDADVLFVHDAAAEERFVADGFAPNRQNVMYNDFVLVGPKADPAGAAGQDILGALSRIAAKQTLFISRGDASGTNAAELRYWKDAGIAPHGAWYRDIAQGMGPALNMASATGAYTLSDRGTWLAFANRAGLAILVEGDKRLFNQYGAMLVNPARWPHVNARDGQAFIDWLVSPEGQATIAAYKIGGQQLFFPNAAAPVRTGS